MRNKASQPKGPSPKGRGVTGPSASLGGQSSIAEDTLPPTRLASGQAVFHSRNMRFEADSCEPLRQAVRRGEVRLSAFCHRHYPGRILPDDMVSEVSSVGYWDALANQTWGLDAHRNEGIEVTYLSRGKLDFQVDGHDYLLESGSLTVTRPWQEHRVGNPHVKASRLHWLILDVGVRRPDQPWQWPKWFILSPADLRRLTILLRHNENPVWQADPHISECFEQLASLTAVPHPSRVQSRLHLYLNHLFLALLELLQRKKVVLDARLSSTPRTVELFLNSLGQHLEQPWDLASMASQCGLGRTQFTHYCRQITNQTPIDFLTHRRLEAARKMLIEEKSRSVTDIALACGFQSSQYFTTVFHQKLGCSPRDYRLGRGPSSATP